MKKSAQQITDEANRAVEISHRIIQEFHDKGVPNAVGITSLCIIICRYYAVSHTEDEFVNLLSSLMDGFIYYKTGNDANL